MNASFLPSLLVPIVCLLVPLILLNSFFRYLAKDSIS